MELFQASTPRAPQAPGVPTGKSPGTARRGHPVRVGPGRREQLPGAGQGDVRARPAAHAEMLESTEPRQRWTTMAQHIEDYALIGDLRTPPWSAPMEQSTGCACRASTPRPSTPPCSGTPTTAMESRPGRQGPLQPAPVPCRHPGTGNRVEHRGRRRSGHRLHGPRRCDTHGRADRGRPGRSSRDADPHRADGWLRQGRPDLAPRSRPPARDCGLRRNCGSTSDVDLTQRPDGSWTGGISRSRQASGSRSPSLTAPPASYDTGRRWGSSATEADTGPSGSRRSTYTGLWRTEVNQSLIILKALTYAPTGSILAAATTSLPEQIGGSRNWDYRYSWLRDATFTWGVPRHRLPRRGRRPGGTGWCAPSPKNRFDLQIMYAIDGAR